jgi:hypothetical protein
MTLIKKFLKQNLLAAFTSTRIRMPKYWIHAENEIFIPSLFMIFLDVIEVSEHDKAIKKLVSVCCVCVCVCVCMCVCVCHHDYSTFLLCYRGRDGAKIFVILLWWTDKLLRFRAWQFRDVRDKKSLLAYFWDFFNFFDIFVDCWVHKCCSWRLCASIDVSYV